MGNSRMPPAIHSSTRKPSCSLRELTGVGMARASGLVMGSSCMPPASEMRLGRYLRRSLRGAGNRVGVPHEKPAELHGQRNAAGAGLEAPPVQLQGRASKHALLIAAGAPARATATENKAWLPAAAHRGYMCSSTGHTV